MDCSQVREELDAYALGALAPAEAAEVAEHVAGCVGCWEELEKSVQTAALVALTARIERAPLRLRERIVTQAQREMPRVRTPQAAGHRSGVGRFGWRLATGALGVATLGAFAFAAFLQVQMEDLRDEKDSLESQVATSGEEIEQQQQVLAVLAAADAQKVPMEPSARAQTAATGTYNWSETSGWGYIFCDGLPDLAEGEVFTVWLTFVNDDPESIGSFVLEGGGCQAALGLKGASSRPKGIGITKERVGASGEPNTPWLLYALFEE